MTYVVFMPCLRFVPNPLTSPLARSSRKSSGNIQTFKPSNLQAFKPSYLQRKPSNLQTFSSVQFSSVQFSLIIILENSEGIPQNNRKATLVVAPPYTPPPGPRRQSVGNVPFQVVTAFARSPETNWTKLNWTELNWIIPLRNVHIIKLNLTGLNWIELINALVKHWSD